MPDQPKIAFCGTRGLPARYGGFETAVDEITKRMTTNGVICEVFCRYSSTEEARTSFEGRSLVYVKGSTVRSLDTFVSSIQTGWYLFKHRREYAHVFWFSNANLPGILLTWLSRIPFSVNTDGLEWRRAKWSWPFKLYYWLASFVIAKISKSLIADSIGIQNFYRQTFAADSHFIPYGSPTIPQLSQENRNGILASLNLERQKYFLQITRFEPDNLPLNVVQGFVDANLAQQGYQMVLVGFSHQSSYSLEIKSHDGQNGIRILNAIYDAEILAALRQNCFCYVHGNSVGGTNPALLEAMACCPRVLAIESPFSREALAETGFYFTTDTIANDLRTVLKQAEQRSQLFNRVTSHYSWDAVSEAYYQLARGQNPQYRLATKAETNDGVFRKEFPATEDLVVVE